MGERIKRVNDKDLYQPKIHSERIRDLYRIRILTHIPMTVLLDMAIAEFVEKIEMEFEEKHEFKPEEQKQELSGGDDPEDLSAYLEPYQNDPFGDLWKK